MKASTVPPCLPASPTLISPTTSEEVSKPLLEYIQYKVNLTPKLGSPFQTPTPSDMTARSDASGAHDEAADATLTSDVEVASMVSAANNPPGKHVEVMDATLESDVDAASKVSHAADVSEDSGSLVMPRLADSSECGEESVTPINYAPAMVLMPNGDDSAPHCENETVSCAPDTNGESCVTSSIPSISFVAEG
jgi:hypothetical protein